MNTRFTMGVFLLITALSGVGGVMAQEPPTTAEGLVQSMKRADMTYRQLMQMMGEATATMTLGILAENKQMVEQGTHFIFTHPAPNHNPWSIMPAEDQAGFKQALLAFDQILDTHSRALLEAARAGDWAQANQSYNDLTTACITCHEAWREKAVTRIAPPSD
ncbi:cytochrome c [Thioalbus denitrificans]|uniref:Cytochrome c n=1 Tax=Thioalbus denitrificans TaxID=547122 RepID=A0A369C222_9GAMM|nr:cytochrome c [Thioalbus denitrificans]RCX28010.1 hypothetical protein DFQ59_10838 [Thioalbus denitrificans]